MQPRESRQAGRYTFLPCNTFLLLGWAAALAAHPSKQSPVLKILYKPLLLRIQQRN